MVGAVSLDADLAVGGVLKMGKDVLYMSAFSRTGFADMAVPLQACA